MSLQNFFMGIQASTFVGHTLLAASAVVSALLTEAVTGKQESSPNNNGVILRQDRRRSTVLSVLRLAVACLIIFVVELVAVFALIMRLWCMYSKYCHRTRIS